MKKVIFSVMFILMGCASGNGAIEYQETMEQWVGMPEPSLLEGKRSDIHVERQVEQQAKPIPLTILAAMISVGLCASR